MANLGRLSAARMRSYNQPSLRAKRSNPSCRTTEEWIASSLCSSQCRPNMNPPSRGTMCPRFNRTFAPSFKRGCREDRVHAAPAISCAMCTEKCAHEHTGTVGTLRPSPRNGFTAYNALTPATGFLATVISEISPANLTPASGRQVHTTSPYASAARVLRSFRVHRISTRVRDDRDPPLHG